MLAGEVAFAKYLCSVWDKQLCQLKAVFYHRGSDGIAVFEVVGLIIEHTLQVKCEN